MNITRFFKWGFVLAGLLCALTFQAAAQPAGGGGGGAAGRGMGGVLTQEQRTSMREAIQGDLAPLMQKLQAAQKEVVKAAMANASEDTIKAKMDAVNKVQTDIALLRVKGLKAIASTLTDEQKTRLENAPDGGFGQLLGAMAGGGRGGARGGRAGARQTQQ